MDRLNLIEITEAKRLAILTTLSEEQIEALITTYIMGSEKRNEYLYMLLNTGDFDEVLVDDIWVEEDHLSW